MNVKRKSVRMIDKELIFIVLVIVVIGTIVVIAEEYGTSRGNNYVQYKYFDKLVERVDKLESN